MKCLPLLPGEGGGGHSGMVWLTGAAPPWGAVAVGGTVRLTWGAGDPPKISMIGGSTLLGLLFPCVYTVTYIYTFWLSGRHNW